MSTNHDDASRSPEESDADLLNRLIRAEMTGIPLENWGYFFPTHVAVWRYIEARRPGVLGPLNAGYDSEPYFAGKGAPWFTETLGNDNEYLDMLEAIMYPVTKDAPPPLIHRVVERGFFREHELPPLDRESVARLAQLVLTATDEGVRNGLIT